MNSHELQLIVYTDGSIMPDRSGAGVVVCNRRGEVLQLINNTLPVMTNNEAEYEGLLLAFNVAGGHGAHTLEIRMDSEIVVGQMSGRFAVNSPRLKRMHQKACELARQFSCVHYVHIPRDLNALADALAAEASAGRRWRTAKRG